MEKLELFPYVVGLRSDRLKGLAKFMRKASRELAECVKASLLKLDLSSTTVLFPPRLLARAKDIGKRQ